MNRISIVVSLVLAACTAPTTAPVTPPPTLSAETAGPTSEPIQPTTAASPWVAAGTIDQRYTTPTLEYRSTGSYLLWSTGLGTDRGDPDLFGCEPGGPVTQLYANPNRDSRLELVGGELEDFVFVEVNERLFGRGGWRLWYLAGSGAEPELIDAGAGYLPFFDVSAGRLVWTKTTTEPSDSALFVLDLATMHRSRLLHADASQMQFWFPSLDGERVAYGTLERAADGRGEIRHVYVLALDGSGDPDRLDTSGLASEPDIRGDVVVWKESSLEEDFVVGGPLYRMSLATREVKPLKLNPDHELERYTDPQIGSRYIAASAGYDRALYLADVETGQPLKIIDLGATSDDQHDSVGLRVDLVGELLAYPFGPADGHLELRWIRLG